MAAIDGHSRGGLLERAAQLCRTRRAARCDGNQRAFSCESFGDARADTAAGSGDEHSSAFETFVIGAHAINPLLTRKSATHSPM